MRPARLIQRDFKDCLARLVAEAQERLVICSPFVSEAGVQVVIDNLTARLSRIGGLLFVTDLSPINICESATDPNALALLGRCVSAATFFHLPRVHAKVFVADTQLAIISSANLTAGGLYHNYEYGIQLRDHASIVEVCRDVSEYGSLGTTLTTNDLDAYCAAANGLRDEFRRQRKSRVGGLTLEFRKALCSVEDELIRARLAGGAVHTVFAKTISYLLRRHGALTTRQLHPLIAAIHPDLCDDSLDRVIDGKHFGKKWKHAVRIAQQQLKKKGMLEYDGNIWKLV